MGTHGKGLLRAAMPCVVLSLLLSGTACSRGLAAREAISRFDNATSDLRELAGNRDWLTEWGSKLDEARSAAAGDELEALLSRLPGKAAIAGAVASAHVNTNELNQVGTTVAEAVPLRLLLSKDERELLTEISKDLAQEIGCGVIWDAMTGLEHDEVSGALSQNQVLRAYDLLVNTSEEALAERALVLAAGLISAPLRSIVESGEYLNGLREKATTVMERAQAEEGRLSELIVVPSGARTRAYYMYAQQCLKPPG